MNGQVWNIPQENHECECGVCKKNKRLLAADPKAKVPPPVVFSRISRRHVIAECHRVEHRRATDRKSHNRTKLKASGNRLRMERA